MPASARRKQTDDLRELLRVGRWREFLERLAGEYNNAVVALAVHDLVAHTGKVLDAANMAPHFVRSYSRFALGNPWIFAAWGKPQGYFISGEDEPEVSEQHTKTDPRMLEFAQKWLIPQNLWKGQGAILLKDTSKFPWIIAIAMLRPEGPPGIGAFSQDEKNRFKNLIPDMEEAILKHPFVRENLATEAIPDDLPNKPARKGKVVKRRNKLLDEFKDYLAEQGLSQIASEAAASGLENFLAERKLTIGPERPPEPPRPPSPTPPKPAEEGPSASASLPLPTQPPARWPADRLPKESAPQFIKRNYGPWLGKGLRRSDIGRLDRPLYNALRNWLLRHDQTMPEDVPLPSQMQQSSALVDTVFKGDTVTVTISHPDPAERVRAIRRLGENLRYHEKKDPPSR